MKRVICKIIVLLFYSQQVGLTENPKALRKWIIAGPELAYMVEIYEQEILNKEGTDENSLTLHHTDTAAFHKKFYTDIRNLEHTFIELGNPFMEESQDLYDINSEQIAAPEVVKTIWEIEDKGESQYHQFAQERLHEGRSLLDTIKLNKFPMLGTAARAVNKVKAKITGLKNDCNLFSRLYIATCEHRAGDLEAFFAHENQASPPSLSVLNKIRSCTKSDLMKCLIDGTEFSTAPNAPRVTAKILVGAAIVHMLQPGQGTTFLD